jgi:glycosyltransferase involved in cell wall biosynthesis
MIFFSIIIPTYNRADLIECTIKSVLGQSFDDFEIIVIDDGSTDNTEKILKKFAAVNFRYFKIENGERGAARNYGVTKAKGKYVFFLDSDDILFPNHLSRAYEYLTTHNYPEFFHSRFDVIDIKGEKIEDAKPLNSDVKTSLLLYNFMACMFFLRRDAALSLPFNEDRQLAGSEDRLLVLQALSRWPLQILNESTAALREHPVRSMQTFDYKTWLNQTFKIEQILKTDKPFMAHFGSKGIGLFLAGNFNTISVKLAVAGNKKMALAFFVKSFKYYPVIILKRNTLSFIKYLWK